MRKKRGKKERRSRVSLGGNRFHKIERSSVKPLSAAGISSMVYSCDWYGVHSTHTRVPFKFPLQRGASLNPSANVLNPRWNHLIVKRSLRIFFIYLIIYFQSKRFPLVFDRPFVFIFFFCFFFFFFLLKRFYIVRIVEETWENKCENVRDTSRAVN